MSDGCTGRLQLNTRKMCLTEYADQNGLPRSSMLLEARYICKLRFKQLTPLNASTLEFRSCILPFFIDESISSSDLHISIMMPNLYYPGFYFHRTMSTWDVGGKFIIKGPFTGCWIPFTHVKTTFSFQSSSWTLPSIHT